EEFSAKRKVEIGEFRGRFCVFVIGHVQGFWGFLSRALAPVKHFLPRFPYPYRTKKGDFFSILYIELI
ncbi:MAG: hypothetical protein ACSHX0_12270, partial [Akkermansiaceae bacterium]